tara:strand:+ start:14212 stop:16017 length:1806 start_codon:yes stop_codon:yes gene_type:complete
MADFDPQQFLSHVSREPGVYQMFDDVGTVIYVGKAKELKSRLSSYFREHNASPKTQVLVSKIADIQVMVTNTEKEALLLEQTLIKTHHPRYNVLLRDDKSYPYIHLNSEHAFPQLKAYRGLKRKGGRYFGPYPNAYAVRETLQLMQKLFKIRSCRDSFFRNRTRPCLQYQIKRCKAPCVGLINEADYRQDLQDAILFLEGKSQNLITEMAKRMDLAANSLEFEKASEYRDLIANLNKVREQQFVVGDKGDVDIIAAVEQMGSICIAQLVIRDGKLLGNKTHIPKSARLASTAETVSAFLAQRYLHAEYIPNELWLSEAIEDEAVLQDALSEQAQHKVQLRVPSRGDGKRWVHLGITNAEQALQSHLQEKSSQQQRVHDLQQALGLESLPERIECFDISHTMGEATVASCVVHGREGPIKADYRRFNIKDITGGDDYAAMHQALTRRYQRVKKEEGKLPDILIIDGGKGQITQAREVLEELQIDTVALVGIAKGATRKAGLEIVYFQGKAIDFSEHSLGLNLLQFIRDESHRFAISGHRQQRGKAKRVSTLEQIDGIGPKRRRELLRHFGGLQALKTASLDDIGKVPGISASLAKTIFDVLR